MIDTDATPTDELGATVAYLDDILRIRRSRTEPQPPSENFTVGEGPKLDVNSPGLPVTLMPPVAATAPLTLVDLQHFDDIDVEVDNEGTVTAVTTTVELPVAPPPPPSLWTADAAKSISLPPQMPAPPGPAVAAELDKAGMPWDGRIHASNRAKKINGTWKNKRGVDTATVTACEAQNKPGNAPSVPTASVAVQLAPAIAMGLPVTGTVSTTNVTTVANTAPPPPPLPVPMVGVVVPAAVVPSAIDFRGLMQKIQTATAAGKLSAEQVNTALAGVGLKPEEMGQLINNSLLIASLNAAVDACLQ